MSEAVVVSVAKAVAARLNAATLSREFLARRSYAEWELELEDSDKLHVDVVAVMAEQATALSTRGGRVGYTVAVDIAVRQRFGGGTKLSSGQIEIERIDALVLLVQEIHELFTAQRLSDFTAAAYDADNPARILANPIRNHLREWTQFTGVVRVTFLATK